MLNSGRMHGSYTELRWRVLRHLNAAHIDDRVFELIQAAYSSALAEERLVLSTAEKRRLLADVLKSVLADMVKTGKLGPVRSAIFRRRCSAPPGVSAAMADRPSARTTRHHGVPDRSGSSRSTRQTRRAYPGRPARFATSP